MLTINKVNKEICAHGLKMELCKGVENYFYFVGEDVDISQPGVYVYRLNQLSLNQWLDEAFERTSKK